MTYGDIKSKLIKEYRLIHDDVTLVELQDYIIRRMNRLGHGSLSKRSRMELDKDLKYVKRMIREEKKNKKKNR